MSNLRTCIGIALGKTVLMAKVVDTGEIVEIEVGTLDPFHRLDNGVTFQIDENDGIEYQYSKARRNDIREYHREEAACGCI
jgi:hypothetical protein